MDHSLIEKSQTACDTIRNPTLTEQLKQRQARAQEEYDEVTALLDKLKKNPVAAEIFDAVSRLGGLGRY